jgi:hypothetical protein
MNWPSGLRCDLVDVPLESSCGVITQLDGRGLDTCPVAQVGDRLLFLVAADTTASDDRHRDNLPPDLVIHRAVDRLPDADGMPGDRCWVIPPPSPTSGLPLASVVLGALCSAYAEHGAVRAVST